MEKEVDMKEKIICWKKKIEWYELKKKENV